MARSADIAFSGRTVAYRYVALTSQGTVVRGDIKAADEAAAERLLAERGYRTVSLELVPSRLSVEQLLPSFFSVKPREVIIFSRQLATLLDAGITLLPALELIRGQAGSSRAFKKVLNAIINDLHTGSSFSQSIFRHRQVFGEIYYRTIATGERTGSMQTVLKQMAEHLEKQGATMKKVTKSLSYPIMIAVVGVIVVVILMTTALPPMIEMFLNLNVPLPLPTRILIALTQLLTAYKLHLFVAVLSLVLLGAWYLRQPTGRRMADRIRLTAPLIGPPTHMAEMARFSRTVSLLVAAGLPLQEITELMPQTSNNSVIRDALNRVHQELLLGQGLSGPMSRIPVFPPLLVQMVTVGEESNSLDSSLQVVANFYENATEEKLGALVGFIQPAATLVVALAVAFIALSVIMPMYTITGAFG